MYRLDISILFYLRIVQSSWVLSLVHSFLENLRLKSWFYCFYSIKVFLIGGGRNFSFSEAALLLVSIKKRDLWGRPTPEDRDPRTLRHSAHVESGLTI